MISIISPAKSLSVTKEDKFIAAPEFVSQSQCDFSQNSAEILEYISGYKPDEIKKLMNVSEKIAQLNYDRFQNFQDLESKQALLAFDGDVYANMQREEYNQDDFSFAQKHLRIMSGFYGILKPLDMIKPYRLEMSTKLTGLAPKGMDKYWQQDLTIAFNKLLSTQENPVLINLASNEYSAAINFKNLEYAYANIHFRENKNGELKNIAINAKKARGMVANYIIKNQIDKVEDLLSFSVSGYCYDQDLSDEFNIFFVKN